MRVVCDWCANDPLLTAYHDDEWGYPLKDDDALFELLTLEIFQAGLSWKTILNRRDGFRKAFDEFSVSKVAEYAEPDIERLVGDAGIIRNRLKIRATVTNAGIIKDLQKDHGSFQAWLDSMPAGDLENYQKVFRKTFKFCGPEITRMFVMAIGMVEVPHDSQCWRRS